MCECCQFEREGGRGREICPQYRQHWFSKHKQSISNLQNELSMESCEHGIFHFSCWVAIRREKNHSFARKECSCHPLINFHYWVSDFQSWICLVNYFYINVLQEVINYFENMTQNYETCPALLLKMSVKLTVIFSLNLAQILKHEPFLLKNF